MYHMYFAWGYLSSSGETVGLCFIGLNVEMKGSLLDCCTHIVVTLVGKVTQHILIMIN